MGLAKIVYKVALAGTIFVAGMYVGNKMSGDSDYAINRTNQAVMLEAKNVDKAYELTKIDDEVYMGSAIHNLNGVKALAFGDIEAQADSIDSTVDNNKIMEAIEEIGDKVVDKYNDVKDKVTN
ncbi:hypothetical protein HQ533_04265 [Candidatus Woesearchaeota archaeon]|nr:hypothetical protein [Candidatus Woesearchaeota archaeon]